GRAGPAGCADLHVDGAGRAGWGHRRARGVTARRTGCWRAAELHYPAVEVGAGDRDLVAADRRAGGRGNGGHLRWLWWWATVMELVGGVDCGGSVGRGD